MAKVELLFQGVRDQQHKKAIQEMYSHDDCENAIISVAFALVDGVGCISEQLTLLGTNVSVYVGIRNSITSGQALLALLSCGVNLYVVDCGSPSVLFHPKIYFARRKTISLSLIGSANLTFSGLNNNIEASTIIELKNSNHSDSNFIRDLESLFGGLLDQFPEHVIPVQSVRDIVNLMRQGRLTDERARVIVPPISSPRLRVHDLISRIPIRLFRKAPKITRKRTRTIIHSKTPNVSGDYLIVWTSNGLTERDLNIPTGSNTNATGSMLLNKGKMEDIDQRHYFFDQVFKELEWREDNAKPHLLRSAAKFCLIIKGADFGTHILKLTHNTNTESKTYKQNNSMTNLHWGDAKNLIAKKDLLGSTLKLYKNSNSAGRYVVEFSD